jgi:hypothetical protein
LRPADVDDPKPGGHHMIEHPCGSRRSHADRRRLACRRHDRLRGAASHVTKAMSRGMT